MRRDAPDTTSKDASSRDVDRLRRENAELNEQLRRARQRFDLFFDHSPLGYLCLDAEGRIEDVNAVWLDLFATDRDAVVGRPLGSLLDPGSRSVFTFHFGRLRSGECIADGRYGVLRGDGATATVAVSANPVMDGDRFVQGHWLFRDVTGMERRMRLLSMQRDLGTLLSGASSFTEAMELVLDMVTGMEGIDCGAVFARQPRGGYRLLHHRGLSGPYTERVQTLAPGSPRALLQDRGRPLYGPYEALFGNDDPVCAAEGLGMAAMLPLRRRGEVIGALTLATRGPGGMPEDLRHTLQAVASQAGSAMAIFRSLDELRAGEARSRSIIEAVREGIILKDASGGYVLWNRSAEDILGLRTGADGRVVMPMVLHPDGTPWPESDSPGAVTLRTGRPVRGASMRVLRDDDSERWLSVNASPLIEGPGPDSGAVVISFRDVTESRRAEEALRNSEAMLRSLFQAAPMGIGVMRRGRVLGWTNERLQAMLGCDAVDLEGQHASLVFPDPDLLQQVGASRFPLMRQGQGSIEVRLQRRDGSRFDALVSAAALDAGDSEAVVFTVTDVTELKRVQQDLLRAKEAAEAANAVKGVFLANMSHELRTPLSGIMGMLRLLDGADLDAGQQDCVRTALATGKSLLAVINDILDFSKMEAGVMELAERPFQLRRCLEQVADNFRILARDKGLDMTLAVDSGVPVAVTGDEVRLRQVLFNLLGNAVKYTDRGGVRLEAWSAVRKGADGNGADRVRLLFRISDTGSGIPDEKVAAVFEAFRQGEEDLSRRYQGAGLGLGIVRRLVGLMGGNLAVDSEPGRGTDMYLSIPMEASRDMEDPEPRPRPAGLAEAGGLRILLAEDDRVNRMASKRFLELMGHYCACAVNGLQVLEMLAAEPFDCVLMDIQMPEMDGMEATRAIRAHDGGDFDPGLPVIAMTAHAMKGDREHFLACGMDDYLAKPVDPDDLARVLERLRTRVRQHVREARKHRPD